MATLRDSELATVLAAFPGWRLEGELLVRDLVFKDGAQAMYFVQRVAMLVEEDPHHPDITIRYSMALNR